MSSAPISQRQRRTAQALSGVRQVVQAGTSVIAGVLVARSLGSEALGRWAAITALVSIASAVAVFRLDFHLLTLWTRGDRRANRGALYVVALPAVLLAVSSAVVVAFASTLLNGVRPLEAVIGGALVLLSLREIPERGLAADNCFIYVASVAVAMRLAWVFTILAIFLVTGEISVLGVLLTRAMTEGVTLLLLGLRLRVRVTLPAGGSGPIEMLRQSGAKLGGTVRRATPLAVTAVAGLVYTRVDQVMLATMLGNAEAGLYSVKVRIVDVGRMAVVALQFVGLPLTVTAPDVREQMQEARALLRTGVAATSTVAIAAALGGPLVAVALFGAGFGGGHAQYLYLGLAGVSVAVGSAATAVALAADRRRVLVTSTVLGALVNVLLNVLLIPEIGAEGAAFASAASYGLVALVIVRDLKRNGATEVSGVFTRPASLIVWGALLVPASVFAVLAGLGSVSS